MSAEHQNIDRTFARRKLALALILGLVCVAFCLGAMALVGDRSWGLDEIEAYLKAPIPNDAQDVNYTSGTNSYVHVELSFKASTNSALSFANHFCDGVLHQGYDPFNAINVDEQVPGSFRIDLIDTYTRSIYSYSPRASQSTSGVFCYLPNGLFWVMIDRSDPAHYAVKFRFELDRTFIFADVKPVADFPIMVRGLSKESDGGYSVLGPICLNLDPDAVGGKDPKWNSIIGFNVQVLIDGQPMTNAYVSNDGRLVRKDGKSNFSDPESNLFKYCLLLWQRGLHTITVQIPLGTGTISKFSWTIDGQISASCGSSYPDNDCYGN